MIEQGWMVDDGPDEDDIRDDPYDLYEDDEPPCWGCWDSESAWCWTHLPPPLRIRRRWIRRWRQQQRQWRKAARHNRDRFWQARNRPAFDEEAPF